MAGFDDNIANACGAGRLCFADVVKAAADTMTPHERATAYRRTGHGVCVYTEEDQLNAYLVAYGEMHKLKLENVLGQIDRGSLSRLIANGVSIVDWGCGQGLASLVFIDWLRSAVGGGLNVKAVRLLEMSDIARARAEKLVSKSVGDSSGNVVRAIPWLPGIPLTFDNFSLPGGTPVIHLFSNILDVAAIDLRNVCNVVEAIKVCGRSLMIAVSPKNLGSERIGAFWQMLGMPRVLARASDSIELRNCQYVKNLRYCTAVGMGCVLEGAPQPERYERLTIYHVFDLGGASDAAFDGYVPEWGKYCYSSADNEDSYTFDKSAVAPVYAVLNNMIVRGSPLRAGLAVERWLTKHVGVTVEDEASEAAYKFRLKDEAAMRPSLESVRKRIDPMAARPAFTAEEVKFERLLVVPLMVSRIQHAVMRGLMSGRIIPKQDPIRVLAVEHDVPCAKLALDELGEMMENIMPLVKDEFSMPVCRFDVTACLPEEVSAHAAETFDVVVDAAFYKSSSTSVCFSTLKGRFGFGVCVESARKDAPHDGFQVITGDNIVYRPIAEKLPDGTFGKLELADRLRYFLRSIFRKRDFRPGQLPILNRALQDRSVIGLLPTGGGKSLTYQLAGMMQPGVVMIIDPLRSLMKDQYDGLVRVGISAAAYVNSSQTMQEQRDAMKRVVNGNSKFLFVSPERLTMPGFRKELQAMYENGVYYSYGVIDEVHCVSEWGHDFRFTYLHLGRNIHRYVRRKPSARFADPNTAVVPIFGLTATASFDVLSDVERELSGPGAYELDADSVIRYENTNRLELQYRIERVEPPKDPDADMSQGEYLAMCVSRQEARVKENEALLAADPNNRGMQMVTRNSKADLRMAKGKMRKFYSQAKEASLEDTIGRQGELFAQLLAPESISRMKKRFLERESIDPKSKAGRSVAAADLDTSVDVEGWSRNPPDYSSAALVFCPYKGFKPPEPGKPKKPTALTVESIKEQLKEKFSESAIRFFTGGTDDKEYDQVIMRNQDDYIQNNAAVMVATTAFGMGIDKPNIRFVIEMNHPKSIEAFVQEAGRAGRDRKMALATIYFSGQSQVDLDVVDFFHKKNFVGLKDEEKRISRLMNNIDMPLEEEDGSPLGGIKGFYKKLMATPVGGSIIVTIPFQWTPKSDPNTPTDPDAPEINEQDVYDKLVYRLCCIGLVQDVECIYTPGSSPRELRLRMVHFEEGGYYAELKNFLMRYFNETRADAEVEKAKQIGGLSEIGNCMHYLEKFVYENVQRKRKLAMDDMNAFCKEGLRAYEENGDWLAVNEDLKDFIYYYFNSKFARSGYRTLDDKPYSLIDDTDAGKNSGFDIIEKYMEVADEHFQGGASPKDNVKHLLGAVRLIARGAPELNPTLSILHGFCLCYLGFTGNRELVGEAIRRIGPEGVGLLLERHTMPRSEVWERLRWLRREFGMRTDRSKRTLDGIFAAARAAIHTSRVKEIVALAGM